MKLRLRLVAVEPDSEMLTPSSHYPGPDMRVLACVLFALAWSAVIAMPLVGYFDASEMRRFAPPLLTITALSFALSGGYFAVQANLEDWARKIEMQRTHKASQHP